MLTVLVGNDTAKRAKRLDALLTILQNDGAKITSISDISFDVDSLRTVAGSSSLFGGKTAVVIYGVGDVAEKRDALERILPELADSPNQFIISENALLAGFLKKAEKGGMVEKFELKVKPTKAEVFNTFALADSFTERNRSLTWSLYRKAIDLGLESRELHGKIFWAVKAMLAARSAKSPIDSGLSPFVYSKSKKGSANFKDGELESITTELATLFHEALVSGIDLETAMEAFILRALAKR